MMIRKNLYEDRGRDFYGVKLYDEDSGEYVVYWSKNQRVIKDIYRTLKDLMWIRYDDVYDFAYQVNPKFNHFTYDENTDFDWDVDESFISDGIHENGDSIDIIYELKLPNNRISESIRRKHR